MTTTMAAELSRVMRLDAKKGEYLGDLPTNSDLRFVLASCVSRYTKTDPETKKELQRVAAKIARKVG